MLREFQFLATFRDKAHLNMSNMDMCDKKKSLRKFLFLNRFLITSLIAQNDCDLRFVHF